MSKVLMPMGQKLVSESPGWWTAVAPYLQQIQDLNFAEAQAVDWNELYNEHFQIYSKQSLCYNLMMYIFC